MQLTSRDEAIERGLTRFFTGKPCKNGHTSERSTLSYACLECMRSAKTVDRQRVREKRREVHGG